MIDGSTISGSLDIMIFDKDGNPRKIWQEFPIFHYLRKNFGFKIPKLLYITGYLTLKAHYSNIVTNSGKALIAGRINGVGSPVAPTYMAIGTGVTAASASDTTLQTELSGNGLSRASGTTSIVTTTVTNDTCQLIASWTSSSVSDVAVTEMGIFNAASSGTMLVRNVFSAYNIRTNDTFQITHNLKNA